MRLWLAAAIDVLMPTLAVAQPATTTCVVKVAHDVAVWIKDADLGNRSV